MIADGGNGTYPSLSHLTVTAPSSEGAKDIIDSFWVNSSLPRMREVPEGRRE